MDDQADVTREQMDETRASLSEQMETLEQRVVDTVSGATDAVAQTVDNVKETLDLRLQLTRHPWAALGGSIALGCLAGYFLMRRDPIQTRTNGRKEPAPREGLRNVEKQDDVAKRPRFQEEALVRKPVPVEAPVAVAPGWLDGIRHHFGPEIDKVQGVAIGTVLGVVRDVITESVPELLKVGLVDVIDGITVKMGGEPIHGPVAKDRAFATAGRQEKSCLSGTERAASPPKTCPTCGHRI